MPAHSRLLVWDKDGTVTSSKDPNDPSSDADLIFPNIATIMNTPGVINAICTGSRQAESEVQNYDPERIIAKLTHFMNQLPISIATFSPAIGGTQCYAVYRDKNGATQIRKAHEELSYAHLKGAFKKPETGMLQVITDLVSELYGALPSAQDSRMIGDLWFDEAAARAYHLPFISAFKVHELPSATAASAFWQLPTDDRCFAPLPGFENYPVP